MAKFQWLMEYLPQLTKAISIAASFTLSWRRKRMGSQSIITAIDAEISRLQDARALLSKAEAIDSVPTPHDGRTTKGKKKRTLSQEARARIAAAQKKRWGEMRKLSAGSAKLKKATAKKAAKKTASKKALEKTEASEVAPF